jgi:exodeoxyribonuclease VII large subunit
MPQEQEIFTLKQVANSIKKTIEERYNRLYWVKAEMHKLNRTMKGHCYPELVQKEDGKIVAEMKGTIWKSNFEKINSTFESIVNEPLKEGITLLFQIKINFHPIYGFGIEIF